VQYTWLAKGFGFIRTQKVDAQGVPVPGTTAELQTIVAAP
jgi:hypothetical protein